MQSVIRRSCVWVAVTSNRVLHEGRRLHSSSHTSADEDASEHTMQTQTKTAGIAETTLESQPSIALQPAPPKVGRHQGNRKRLSGIQQEVLAQYRAFLKEVRKIEDHESRANLRAHIQSEFKTNAAIPRKLLSKVEWQLHYGRNKLEDLKFMRPNSRFRMHQR